MIYVILFSGLIYLNSGQIPTLTDYPCSANSDCDTVPVGLFGSDVGLILPGGPDLTNLADEVANCSTKLGYCTG